MQKGVWVMVLCWILGLGRAGQVEAVVLINEVLADPHPVNGDANQNGQVQALGDEFVELVNTGLEPVGLGGWKLNDNVRTRHIFSPETAIPGQGFFTVFGNGASSGGLGLNNTGDTLTLLDISDILVDVFTYGQEGGRDASLTRFPDGQGVFVRHDTINNSLFSPSTTVDGHFFLPQPEPQNPPDIPEPSETPGPAVVPEPASLLLFGLGFSGLFLRRGGMNRVFNSTRNSLDISYQI